MRGAVFLFAVAACGGKVEITRMEGGDSRAGFVICGDAGSCDVGSGNQCYSCTGTEPWNCHGLIVAYCSSSSSSTWISVPS